MIFAHITRSLRDTFPGRASEWALGFMLFGWAVILAANPDLHFALEVALAGHGVVTILYRNHRGQQVAETVEFGETGKVVRSVACYA